MSIVVAVVNYIGDNGLKQRPFQAFLQDDDAEYSDQVYNMDIHWLSQGAKLQYLLDICNEVVHFLKGDKNFS
jgi:hypothetical protein